MANSTVTDFARELHIPAKVLVEQLRSAGIPVQSETSAVSDADKAKLLEKLHTERTQNAKPRNASAKRMQTLPVPLRRAEPLPHRSSALCIRQNLAKPEL